VSTDPQTPDAPLDVVRTALASQMDSSRKALYKLRRGAVIFPRVSLLPAVITALIVWMEGGELAVVLGIIATSMLLVGAVVYLIVSRGLERAIRRSVGQLTELSETDRRVLLDEWLS
jgi:hypothetical protein